MTTTARHDSDRRTATFVVAASNSLLTRNADYVCSGAADQVDIQAAVDACWAAGGGDVHLTEGDFYFTGIMYHRSRVNLKGMSGTRIHGGGIEFIHAIGTAEAWMVLDTDQANWAVISGTIALSDDAVEFYRGVGSLEAAVTVGGEIRRTFATLDWSYYEMLTVWVRADAADAEISVKVHDGSGNWSQWNFEIMRANGWIELWCHLRNPDEISGTLDLSDVVAIGVDNLDAGTTYNFDDIRLYVGYMTFEDIEFVGVTGTVPGTTLVLHAVAHFTVRNCRFINIGDEAVEAHGCRSGVIDNNFIKGLWDAVALGEGGPRIDLGTGVDSRAMKIINNTIVDAPGGAIALCGNDILCQGNHIIGAYLGGIGIRSNFGTSVYRSRDIVVAFNTIDNADTGLGMTKENFGADPGASYVTAIGNIYKNIVAQAVVSYNPHNTFIGETIVNAPIGYLLDQQCERNMVINPTIIDTTTGIDQDDGDDVVITGGQFNNLTTGIDIAAACNRTVCKGHRFTTVTTPLVDAGTDTILNVFIVAFSDGADPQDSGYLIDADTEYARAYLRLPSEVQQVMRIEVYARSAAAETHEMELEIVVYGGADNEAYNTHDGSIAQLDSVSVNFAADDIIFWRNTEAGTLALLGGDSVEVKVLHEAAEGDNCETDAFFRTVEVQYV